MAKAAQSCFHKEASAPREKDLIRAMTDPEMVPYTLHPTPYTLHTTPYTLQPTPYTLNSKP